MKRLLVGMLVLIALTTGCSLFSSEPGDLPPDQPADQPVEQPAGQPVSNPGVKSPVPISGACQSRLGGRVRDKTKLPPVANATVQVVSSSKKLQTRTDKNGLYGFAGLCAGDYTVSVTPPNQAPIANIGKISLDGSSRGTLDLTY